MTKFYSVVMPDGKTYAATGKSIAKVALRHNVNIKKVTIGVDLLHTNCISEYYKGKQNEQFIKSNCRR